MMWHTIVFSCCIIIASTCPASNDPSPEPTTTTTTEKSESEKNGSGGIASGESDENGAGESDENGAGGSDENESNESSEPEPESEESTEEPKEPSYMLTGTQFHILFQGLQMTFDISSQLFFQSHWNGKQ